MLFWETWVKFKILLFISNIGCYMILFFDYRFYLNGILIHIPFVILRKKQAHAWLSQLFINFISNLRGYRTASFFILFVFHEKQTYKMKWLSCFFMFFAGLGLSSFCMWFGHQITWSQASFVHFKCIQCSKVTEFSRNICLSYYW